MKRVGVEKARSRLEAAFRSFELLKVATDFAEFEVCWGALLTALNSAFDILRESAKDKNSSFNWMFKLVAERRQDELLSYIWHARNVNDHGIDYIVEDQPGGFTIPMPASGALHIKHLSVENGKITRFEGHGFGAPVSIFIHPDGIFLKPVVDRGNEYKPPDYHLGSALADKSPTGIAGAALKYFALRLAEAETLTLCS